jgi:hypothetical protein
MRFRNDTAYPLFIRGLAGSNSVRFEIYSKPLGRSVSFTKPAVSNVRPAIDTTVYTAELKRGQKKRPRRRLTARTFRSRGLPGDASGRTLHVDRWFSHYVRVDGVLQIGTGWAGPRRRLLLSDAKLPSPTGTGERLSPLATGEVAVHLRLALLLLG